MEQKLSLHEASSGFIVCLPIKHYFGFVQVAAEEIEIAVE